ncbi:MAG: RluA family pseudouridine synthase [Parvularculaceae bacterium]
MTGVTNKVVDVKDDGVRLDRWFKLHYPQLKHGALEKLLRTGQIRVDGSRAKSNRRMSAGESVRIPPMGSAPILKNIVYNQDDADFIRSLTLYEDDDILAINKPFGLAVQGGAKKSRHIDGMLASLEKNGERPLLVHRLDQDTGGLLVLAKSRQAARELGHAFQGRDVSKTYWALCLGVPRPREGTIDLPIAKKPLKIGARIQERMSPDDSAEAKTAITDFMTMDDAGEVSFVALKPLTGRTHQLRVHCAAMGAPIIGDRKYGGPEAVLDGVPDGLQLFCREMTFAHPTTGKKLSISAPLTGRMKDTWKFFGFNAEARVDWPDIRKPKKR